MAEPVTVEITPADADEKPASTLAELSKDALQLYRQILLDYGRDSDSAKHVSSEKLLSEYGRLKVWTEQTGATLQERGSLEDMLQEDPDLRNDVASTLRQISVQLLAGKFHLGSNLIRQRP